MENSEHKTEMSIRKIEEDPSVSLQGPAYIPNELRAFNNQGFDVMQQVLSPNRRFLAYYMPSSQTLIIVIGVGFHNQSCQFSLIITVLQIFLTSVNTVKADHLSQAVRKAAELWKAKKRFLRATKKKLQLCLLNKTGEKHY